MSTIYSSLSNPSGDLKQLQQEFADLINFFNEPEIEPKTHFQFALNGTIQDITSYLTKNQKEIRLFHYSGHSGQSGLDFEGDGYDVEHISKFFNALSTNKNLQCVFLNGCENAEIVQQLNKVPVVIGTKTKIQDTVARKVTLDFFKALIGGESTYEDAFNLALKASHIHDDSFTITRSEGSKLAADKDEPLNQYFIQFNDKKIASQQFAFSPKQKNWTKYLFVLLFLLAAVSGFVLKHDIRKLIFGYDCSKIQTHPEKCNFVIADLTAPSDIIDKPTTWLFNNVKATPSLQKYLFPIDLINFKEVIRGSSINQDSLPGLCGYDFNLTGNIEHAQAGIAANFFIFPFDKTKSSLKTVKYKVAALDVLDSIITQLDTSTDNAFVLYEMCIACALKRNFPDLPTAMQTLADEYDPTHSSETYQRFMNDLATVHLQYNNMEKAIEVLNKAVAAVGNDFTLYAVERKIEIYDSHQNFLRSIDTHTELISQLESRVKQPGSYKLIKDVSTYKKGADQVRFKRAMMIFDHRLEVPKDYKIMAIADFKYLQGIHYPPGNFEKEISILEGKTVVREEPDLPIPNDEEIRLSGQVLNAQGQPLDSVEVQFALDKKMTNTNGRFDFGNFNVKEVKGVSLLVSRKGYKYAKVPITKNNISKIILQPDKSAIASIPIQGTVYTQSGFPLPGTTLNLLGKSAKTNAKAEYSFGKIPENELKNQSMVVEHDAYETKTILISKDSYQHITLTPGAPGKYTIRVFGINVNPDNWKKVMGNLKHSQQPIDEQNSKNDVGAEWFGDRTLTIVYYQENLKSTAEALSKLMTRWTDRSFKVKSLTEVPVKGNLRFEDSIVVTWYE